MLEKFKDAVTVIEDMLKEFEGSIINLDSGTAKDLCVKILSEKYSSIDELFRSIGSAMDVVGQKYEAGEYFLSELIMAGEVVKEVLEILEPYYRREEQKYIGTIVLATVKGDLHDIGKNILYMLLRSAGFKLVDLGVDVPAEKIVDSVRANNANIIGLSALLTTTVPQFRNVVDALREAGIRDRVRVIVGGAAVNEEVAKKYGADTWGRTAVEGLKICKELVKS